MGCFSAAMSTLFFVGAFDPVKPQEIRVQVPDCRSEMAACGTGHKCWAAYHECIGAGGFDGPAL